MGKTLYGHVSKDCLKDIRAFVRQARIERPKLTFVAAPEGKSLSILAVAMPMVAFTFEDEASAVAFRMRFRVEDSPRWIGG